MHPMSVSVAQANYHRTFQYVLGLWFLTFSGCLDKRTDSAAPPPVDPDNSPFKAPIQSNRTSNFGTSAQRLVVEFNVHWFTASRGVFSAEDSVIWKIVTGALPESSSTLHLADSGFRAAIGRSSDRKPLADALAGLEDSGKLRSETTDRLIPDASRSASFGIGQIALRTLTVFYQDIEGRAIGYDFRDASPKFYLSYGMRADNLREVILRLVPAIEEPPGPPKWVGKLGEGFQQIQEERRTMFIEMALTATIPEDGLLLMGGTPIIYERPYLGRAFFIEQTTDNKMARESIFIVSPVIRTVTDRFGTPAKSLDATNGIERMTEGQ